MRKTAVLVLTLGLVCISLITVEYASAQSLVPKPSVPQFSIQYVDYSYEVPETYSTDPYTGQQILHPSKIIGDVRVEGKIKNQPFTRYTMDAPNGTGTVAIGFYYNVRYKGHFGEEWTEIYGYHNKDCISQNYGFEYTNFTIHWQEFPEGRQIDYQVKAMIGYRSTEWIGPWPKPIIIGEESNWSNTLTLIFTKNETANGISSASNIDTALYSPLPTAQPTLTATQNPTSTHNPIIIPTPTSIQPHTQNNIAILDLTTIVIVVMAALIAILAVTVVFLGRSKQSYE